MRKVLYASLALAAIGGVAWAQSVGWPPPGGMMAALGVYNSTPPTLTNAQVSPVQISSAGRLLVDAAVTPGGTQTVNIGQVLGTAISATNPIFAIQTSQYPTGAIPLTASATGTTAATTATLAGTSGKTTYVCGFSIRANATAAATGNATVTGTITGTLNYTQWTAPLASGLGINEQVFTPCVPASTTNTGIAVISAAPGSGGVVSSTAWGYQL